MRVVNRTAFPTSEIRRLVRRELARSRPGTVQVLERPFGSDRQGHVRYDDRRVRIWIGGTTRYPYSSTYGRRSGEELAGAPTYEIRDWREDLVATAAHEAFHLRPGARDSGTAAQEIAAERRAVHRLELFRRRRRAGSLLERIIG